MTLKADYAILNIVQNALKEMKKGELMENYMPSETPAIVKEGTYDFGYGVIHIIREAPPDKLTLKIVQTLNNVIVAREVIYYKN